jgi:dipeptidase E
LPDNTLPVARRWAASLGIPAYAIDDDTAIRWMDGQVDVVSEGKWEYLGG